jgi:hypothetical protein
MVLPELKAAVGAALKIQSWNKERKLESQKRSLWTLLAGMKLDQQMTTADIFEQFKWQVDSPLFADEQDVEDVLRSMRNEGVEFGIASKSWRIADRTLEDQDRRTELSVIVPSSKVVRVANTGTRVITKILVHETDYEFNRESFKYGHLAIHSFSKASGPIAMFEKIEPEQTETLDLRTIGFFNFANEMPKGHDAITTLTKVYCLRFEFQSGGRGYVLYRAVSSVVDIPSFFDDGSGMAGGTQLDYVYEIPEYIRRHQKRLFSDGNLVDVSPTRQQQ